MSTSMTVDSHPPSPYEEEEQNATLRGMPAPTSSKVLTDERTPLLMSASTSETLVGGGRRRKKREVERTPLPLVQIGVLLFLQLSEPVTSQAIYPFINEALALVTLERNVDVAISPDLHCPAQNFRSHMSQVSAHILWVQLLFKAHEEKLAVGPRYLRFIGPYLPGENLFQL